MKTNKTAQKYLKIDEKHRQQIENIRKLKQQCDELLDSAIDKLAYEMKLKTEIDNDILWDHIMNDSDWNVEYKASNK